MIVQTYPKPGLKIVPALPWTQTVHQPGSKQRPNAQDVERAKKIGIEPEEFVRRDKIVTNIWLGNPWRVGDMAKPAKAADYEKYGLCRVAQVYRTYFDFDPVEAREWPKKDYPYVLTVQPDKPGPGEDKLFMCTTNWLESKFTKNSSCPTC